MYGVAHCRGGVTIFLSIQVTCVQCGERAFEAQYSNEQKSHKLCDFHFWELHADKSFLDDQRMWATWLCQGILPVEFSSSLVIAISSKQLFLARSMGLNDAPTFHRTWLLGSWRKDLCCTAPVTIRRRQLDVSAAQWWDGGEPTSNRHDAFLTHASWCFRLMTSNTPSLLPSDGRLANNLPPLTLWLCSCSQW